jgi:CO/xanthine dehydrogenase Mo-binding subunit
MSEAPAEPRKFKWVGTRPIRHDGVDKVTGRANYGADFSLPGMLHGKILRSPHAHARILRIDARRALALDGVKAVMTAEDLPEIERARGGDGPIDFRDLSRNVMARGKVLYHGHAVAAVAATTQRIAEQALGLIEVDYEPLPHVLDVRRAMEPGAPLLHDDLVTRGVDPAPERPSNVAQRIEIKRGDVEAGFAEADLVIEREFETATVHQGYIEPHACVARMGEDGQAVVWCCTQGHFAVRALSARLLAVPVSQIKVIASEIGGGFGGKTTIYLEPVAIVLSRKSGRPVKLVMSREEVFRATGPAPATFMRAKVGAKRDGRITAAHAWLAYEAGGFPGSPVTAACMTVLAPYDVENVLVEGYDVVVNKPKTTAYRAPGAPPAAFALETVIDEVAERLAIDPIDLRLANASCKGKSAVYGPRWNDIGLIETLEAARANPQYTAPLGPNQGRGVAVGFWFNGGMQSSASLTINEDGTAVVVSGCPDIGGSRASLAIMAAEELGIDVYQVRPVVADTESIGYNDTTGGSRVTFATGMAVIEAARDVVRQCRERAAKLWEVPVEQVTWRDGCAQLANGSAEAQEPVSLAKLARRAAKTGGPITGKASLTARGVGPAFATHVVDVEVDPETGKVEILRYLAVQDAGRAVHPSYVEGQMQGGVAQGVGWALNEEFVYNADGVLENAGFLDYRMPVALDLPMIETRIVEVPNPRHPYGVRGVGEVPIVPPLPAIANAIYAATGVRMRRLPISPPRLLEALESAADRGARRALPGHRRRAARRDRGGDRRRDPPGRAARADRGRQRGALSAARVGRLTPSCESSAPSSTPTTSSCAAARAPCWRPWCGSRARPIGGRARAC